MTICGFTMVGPLINLFYLSANISFNQLSLIEISGLIVLVILEVPTGVISDILGRKLSLFIGCILMGVEFLMIAFGYNFSVFILAALIGGIGITLESGADEALLYDTLKKLKREDEFQKIIGQCNAMFKVSAACAGILWGYIYETDKTYVFYFSGSILILMGLFSLTMHEPLAKKNCIKKKSMTLACKKFKQIALRI